MNDISVEMTQADDGNVTVLFQYPDTTINLGSYDNKVQATEALIGWIDAHEVAIGHWHDVWEDYWKQKHPACQNCESAEATRKQRCSACYAYLYRTGQERPESAVVAAEQRRQKKAENISNKYA